ncbi:hypothetical protein J4050_04435 [Winogradskyella sp. DF17]|uniref:Uncharacterized protein n=1 Tax=Winogradskyella pelagia TaxID=2819984 RepID=A0ABS3SZS7_9FLAO|nr:hypothetical protein [Winogradskyella sp. DF17]MBO3115980.1 hypothetical protein [Winogradskyella sp. DF17]
MKTPNNNQKLKSSKKEDKDLENLDKELKELIRENESRKDGISKILKKIEDNDKSTNSN